MYRSGRGNSGVCPEARRNGTGERSEAEACPSAGSPNTPRTPVPHPRKASLSCTVSARSQPTVGPGPGDL
jgi:hypothetical protein